MKTRPMRVDDVEQVHAIEQRSFPLPWSREWFYPREICEIDNSHLLVVTEDEDRSGSPEDSGVGVMGYCLLVGGGG